MPLSCSNIKWLKFPSTGSPDRTNGFSNSFKRTRFSPRTGGRFGKNCQRVESKSAGKVLAGWVGCKLILVNLVPLYIRRHQQLSISWLKPMQACVTFHLYTQTMYLLMCICVNTCVPTHNVYSYHLVYITANSTGISIGTRMSQKCFQTL